jgi:putative transposase
MLFRVSASTNVIDFFHGSNYILRMKRLQAFKFELKLSGTQIRQLYGMAGSCRYVFNRALALQKTRYEQGEKKLGYAGLCRELTAWRNEDATRWLQQSPAQALQQSRWESMLV